MRTPLLPADAFLCMDVAEESYAARRERAIARLVELVARPEVREALFVASPGLSERLDRWLRQPTPGGVELAVARYLARMSLRCTPFGLFAGVSVGEVGSVSDFRFGPISGHRKHTRLDMGYLGALVDSILSDPAVRAELSFRPNSSLYRAGGRLHYFEAREGRDGRQFFLVAVDETDALHDTLARARNGMSLARLASALVDDDVSTQEADEYIEELVSAQLLVPDLAPSVTGPHALGDLVAQLADVQAAFATRGALDEIAVELETLDAQGVGVSVERYLGVQARLKELQPQAEASRLLQVDLIKPGEQLRLGNDLAAAVQRAFTALYDLFGADVSDGLETFRRDFRARYGDAELPLVEVLDEESGIGFRAARGPTVEAAPLLAGLELAGPAADERVRRNAVSQLLLRKLCEALVAGAEEVELTDDEIQTHRDAETRERLPLPDAYSVMACMWPSGDGHMVAIDGGGGPSGARILARFCPLDARLDAHVRDHLRAEEALQPGRCFFEIVHLPEGRLGNILGRTVLRQYELSFLGRSGAPAQQQLEITDLMVSVRNDQIVLRSRRLDREVLPRLSSAHNAARKSTGVARCVVEVQRQGGGRGLGWNWGALDSAPALPRVRYGQTVLSPQRWNVRAEEFGGFRGSSPEQFFESFRAWAKGRGLPRLFALTEADRALPVDVENPLSIESFWELVRDRPAFALEEMLPPVDRCAATGPEGAFVHELVVPFVRRQPTAAAATPSPVHESSPRRPLGSDWQYAKIFCGKAAADRVLLDCLAPLQRALTAEGLVDRWFFIRYSEPQFHLRLRAHGDPDGLTREAYPRLLQALAPLLADKRVWQLQLDGYERESVRYGGPEAMPWCEEVFCADSEATVDCLGVLSGDETADLRWKMTLRGMDALLEDFGLPPLRRYQLYVQLSTGFRREFQAERRVKKQVLKRFRRERAGVEAALSVNGKLSDELRAGIEILARRSQRVKPAVVELRGLAARGALTVPLQDIAASMLHMHANRMLRAAARAQEMVLYSMLAEHHDSLLARQGIKGKERKRLLAAPEPGSEELLR